MPKLKTNKSAAKRFKKTARGGFKRANAFHRHILTKKTTKSKRHARGTEMVHGSDVAGLKRLMPYE
jgi:large subunit ribosomal protein L35